MTNVDIQSYKTLERIPLTVDDLGRDSKFRYDSIGMNFQKDLGLKGKYCHSPFNDVTIDRYGECFVCICQAWLPIPVGNIMDFNSLDDIVKSPKAQEIQASIVDGSYRYCDERTCHIIANNELRDNLNTPDTVTRIIFAIDNSCNLRCPSCRTELIFHKEGESFDLRMRMSEHIAKLINNHQHELQFTVSGDGDPFASHIYRQLLGKIDPDVLHDRVIEIVTNGILVKDHWKNLTGIHNFVRRFKISFDAGSPEVYNITRRGGSWNKLLESTKYIVDWKNEFNPNMNVILNFVVQKSNYKDIIKFVRIGNQLGVDVIELQKITDWGTFTIGGTNTFSDHAVWLPNHPNFGELVEIINSPEIVNGEMKVELHNLSHLKN